MKAVCIKSYYDKCLHRSMTPGDELEVTEERFVELSGRKVVKKKEVSDADQVDTLKASGMDGYAGDKYRFIDKFQAWIE